MISGAEKGLECREYEKSDGEDKVIYRTDLSKVIRAESLLNLIEKEYKDIDYFTDNEHQFKKMKGIIAKFSYPGGDVGRKFSISQRAFPHLSFECENFLGIERGKL